MAAIDMRSVAEAWPTDVWAHVRDHVASLSKLGALPRSDGGAGPVYKSDDMLKAVSQSVQKDCCRSLLIIRQDPYVCTHAWRKQGHVFARRPEISPAT